MDILSDKILLQEWEKREFDNYYRHKFERTDIDLDVFKRFKKQGEIIKMTIDAKEILRDRKFWRTEKEIQRHAIEYIQ